MKIAALSDIHGNIAFIERMDKVLKNVDIVLLTGDITNFGKEEETREVIETVSKFNSNILAVSGNCDYPEVNELLTSWNINLHCQSKTVMDILFAGVGGSIITPFNTPFEFTENEIESFLSMAVNGLKGNTPFILVSHQPPANSRCDVIGTGAHVGSTSVRNFIESKKPVVCFTGHIHESRSTDKIGETFVINPGRLSDGHYAYVELSESYTVKKCEVRKI